MTIPPRQRALTGTYALVDGIPFTMPVNSLDSPALMAGFTVDYDQASALIPGEEIKLVRLPRGRALLMITVIDYRTTDIGRYVEFSIAFACYHRRAGRRFLRTLMSERTSAIGQFVWDLPVSSLISVKGGKGIWGMPKHQANLDFVVTDDEMSSQYDLDGELCMRITVKRPKRIKVPVRAFGATNYCQFRGMLMKSSIFFSDNTEIAVGTFANATLMLGAHPRMAPLAELKRSESPIFVACLPHSHGMLDDHFEAWFLTSSEPPDPDQPPEGLESVVDLSKSEEWLSPPTAEGRQSK
jgi:Acetoacetate decarboxylase (ADC)